MKEIVETMSEINQDELATYSVYEVAELLKRSPLTIRRYIKDKKIRSFKCGNEWRVTRSALQDFISELEAKQ